MPVDISKLGWWAAALSVILSVLWSERKRILGFLFGRIENKEKRVLANGEERKETLEKLLDAQARERENLYSLLREERSERRLSNERVIDGARATQEMATQSVEVMQQFADISRLGIDHRDRHDEKILELTDTTLDAVRENTRVNGAIGFVLASIYFQGQQGKTFADLLRAMEDANGKD